MNCPSGASQARFMASTRCLPARDVTRNGNSINANRIKNYCSLRGGIPDARRARTIGLSIWGVTVAIANNRHLLPAPENIPVQKCVAELSPGIKLQQQLPEIRQPLVERLEPRWCQRKQLSPVRPGAQRCKLGLDHGK